MANILADGVRHAAHIKAFNDLVEQRFAGIDITPMLIYIVDTVPADALPYLAEQFDVVGIKGMKYADTEQKQRDLIKSAIEIHRYKGTPWSIKEALKSVGVAQSEVIEGGGILKYDGVHRHTGYIPYGWVNWWAIFRVLIDFDSFPVPGYDVLQDMIGLINEYKNVRSLLLDLSFKVNDTDSVTCDETFSVTIVT